mmetsp:Transcript_39110/g.44761  ORF Transcript_39110/g.44761 Transcript_39110/m.44761 type:complete len:96 (-) Transcript_39110:30-317(-)
MIFVMTIELLGLAIFSYFLGIVTSIQASKSAFYLVQQKKTQVKDFLTQISEGNQALVLPEEIHDKTIENLDHAYKYDINLVFNLGKSQRGVAHEV